MSAVNGLFTLQHLGDFRAGVVGALFLAFRRWRWVAGVLVAALFFSWLYPFARRGAAALAARAGRHERRRRRERSERAGACRPSPSARTRAGMRLDRFFEARFPGLSFSHIQRIIRKGEVRVNGKRAAAQGPAARRARRCASRRSSSKPPKAARRRAARTSKDARVPQIDHAARGRRRAGAQQADGACGAGRLGHHAPSRRHAGGAARPATTASARAWCTGSTRTPPAACWSPRRALPRPRWRRLSARARRGKSTGRWSRACQSRSRAASRRSSPRRSARTNRIMRIAKHGEEGASHAVTYYAVVETCGAARSPGCRSSR